MSILVDENTRLLVQGITGREGSFHASRCRAYGANLVSGVTPGRGGAMFEETVPVYNTVEQAVAETGANASLIFVPPAFAADAIAEAADAGIAVIACITEGIPVMAVVRHMKGEPTTIGLPRDHLPRRQVQDGYNARPDIHARQGRSGVQKWHPHLRGRGPADRCGIGQSTAVGIGGDPVIGTSFIEVLQLFEDDPETDAVVLIGEIGGVAEQEAAEFIKSDFSKPVAALIVGQSAPPGRRMGHAGAIVTGIAGRASEKTKALAAAGMESPTRARSGAPSAICRPVNGTFVLFKMRVESSIADGIARRPLHARSSIDRDRPVPLGSAPVRMNALGAPGLLPGAYGTEQAWITPRDGRPSRRGGPVDVCDLDKTYRNGTHANRDITLSVRRGELLGILGPNGAGKTTLVRQITTELHAVGRVGVVSTTPDLRQGTLTRS